ncbi:MAG TPA: PilZ domain-containing protein [Polyangiaceae bacterium]|nr:PilZ domain-containing protein [Polyangiaceae bacterium]
MTRRPPPNDVLQGQRRNTGGARRESSDRVELRSGDAIVIGWALNRSRGGLRVIVEEASLEEGAEYELTIADDEQRSPRRARVVWVRDEADGQIVGLEFSDGGGGAPPEPP